MFPQDFVKISGIFRNSMDHKKNRVCRKGQFIKEHFFLIKECSESFQYNISLETCMVGITKQMILSKTIMLNEQSTWVTFSGSVMLIQYAMGCNLIDQWL